MKERYVPMTEKRLLSISEFMQYASVGRNRAYRLAKESEAYIKYGRSVLVDREKFDKWCDFQ